MTKARLLLKENKKYLMSSGKIITIATDLWLIAEPRKHLYPDGLKFGWIAFNDEDPNERILLDYTNPKKGFHYHLDHQPIVKLEWISLKVAQQLFKQMIKEKFGEIVQEIEKY